MRYLWVFLGASLVTLSAAGGEPYGWRGDGTGVFSTAKPPTTWSEEAGSVWKTPLPAFSNASPIFLNGKIYICAEVDELICLDQESGKILWRKSTSEEDLLSADEKARREALKARLAPTKASRDKLNTEYRGVRRKLRREKNNETLKAREKVLKAQLDELNKKLQPLTDIEPPRTHKVNGYSSPTPITDGGNIYVMFGTGVVAAFTPDGKRLWARVVEKPKAGWGHSASPVLAGGKLIAAYINVFGLNPQTGEQVWKAESKAHWGTPAAARVGGVDAVVTCDGQLLKAEDGKVLSTKLVSLQYNSPLVVDGVVYTFDREHARAHRLPAEITDGAADPELLWETPVSKNRYYASPVLVEGVVYGIQQKGVLTAIDAATGKKYFEKNLDLGGTVYPSPTVAGGLLYVSSDTGKTIVLKPGAAFNQIQKNQIEGFRSCPVFIGSRLYIRGLKTMYCIGE